VAYPKVRHQLIPMPHNFAGSDLAEARNTENWVFQERLEDGLTGIPQSPLHGKSPITTSWLLNKRGQVLSQSMSKTKVTWLVVFMTKDTIKTLILNKLFELIWTIANSAICARYPSYFHINEPHHTLCCQRQTSRERDPSLGLFVQLRIDTGNALVFKVEPCSIFSEPPDK
jgi:hypothetical protein